MRVVKTGIKIDATPHTVWSILDDLDRYPEWNPLVPEFSGRTIVGEQLNGTIVLQGIGPIPLNPTLLRIVGARELRWITVVPGENGISGEHYFILSPTTDGGTHLVHNEVFEGPIVEAMWPTIQDTTVPVYLAFNQALKARAERMEALQPALHPAVDHGLSTATASATSTLRFHCIRIRSKSI